MKYDTVIIGVAADGFFNFTFENKDDQDNQEQFFVSQNIDHGLVDDLQSMFECIGFKNINVEEVY